MSQPAKKTWRPFPELKNSEIIQIMEELRIPLAEADLLKPNPAHVQRIFEIFVDLFMGGGVSASVASSQQNFSVIELLEYPEIHQDAIALMTFHRNVLKLMEAVGIDDFSLKDIIKPETPRLKIILSGIINFIKFREEQLGLFEDFSAKAEEIQSQKRKLEFQKKDLLDKVTRIRNQRASEEPQVQSLEAEVKALIADIKASEARQSALAEELESLKSKKDDLTDKLASLQFTLMNSKQECVKLSNQIVHNPEILIQTVHDLTSNANEEKQVIAGLEQRARQLQNKGDAYDWTRADLERCLEAMSDGVTLLKTKLDTEQSLVSEKELLLKKSLLLQELETKEQQLERQLQNQQEKTERLHVQQEEKQQLVQKSLQGLRDEYEAISKERVRIQEKIDKHEMQIKDIEARSVEQLRLHEAEVAKLANAYQQLKQQIQHYHIDFRRSLLASATASGP